LLDEGAHLHPVATARRAAVSGGAPLGGGLRRLGLRCFRLCRRLGLGRGRAWGRPGRRRCRPPGPATRRPRRGSRRRLRAAAGGEGGEGGGGEGGGVGSWGGAQGWRAQARREASTA